MLTALDITEAMGLDVQGVRKALDEGGYPDAEHEIETALFLGMVCANKASFVYSINFINHDGMTELGQVYLSYNDQGILEGAY